jgi:hypothetical protein
MTRPEVPDRRKPDTENERPDAVLPHGAQPLALRSELAQPQHSSGDGSPSSADCRCDSCRKRWQSVLAGVGVLLQGVSAVILAVTATLPPGVAEQFWQRLLG